MESHADSYSLSSWLLESEEDFPLGAKTTSFLPSATESNAGKNIVTFELPEWMESRENLGLGNVELFEDLALPTHHTTVHDVWEHTNKDQEEVVEDDITIKPEDMLVPLSELQHSPALPFTPPGTPAALSPARPLTPPDSLAAPSPPPFIPKIIICKKVSAPSLKPIQVQYQVMPTRQTAQAAPTPQMMIAVPDQPAQPSSCDAEELINEMVQMIGNDANANTFTALEEGSFDTSTVEAGMEELLFQLESCKDEFTWESEPLSPAPSHSSALPLPSPVPSISFPVPSLPSPVPSTGSLSPPQSSESIFNSCLLSPSSLKEASASSPQQSEDYDEEWSELEAHSYSRSQRKSKSTRKTSARKSPYSEERKERKKEQNKQAALRYRQKKKLEDDDMNSKINAEEERQKQLKAKHQSLKQELSYLKKIMREVFIAKGMISEDAFKKTK